MSHSTARLETFSDGVFAIAITLLVLEIKVPPPESIHANHTLLQAITGHWSSWMAFVLSFFNLTIAWVNHHNAFKLVGRTTPLFNFANGFFLLTVAIIPFPTAVLAEYLNTDSAHTAVMIYCLAITLHSLAWFVFYQCMIRPRDLTKGDRALTEAHKQRRNCLFGAFLYLVICALAYWYPWIALFLLIALYIFWIYVAITTKIEED